MVPNNCLDSKSTLISFVFITFCHCLFFFIVKCPRRTPTIPVAASIPWMSRNPGYTTGVRATASLAAIASLGDTCSSRCRSALIISPFRIACSDGFIGTNGSIVSGLKFSRILCRVGLPGMVSIDSQSATRFHRDSSGYLVARDCPHPGDYSASLAISGCHSGRSGYWSNSDPGGWRSGCPDIGRPGQRAAADWSPRDWTTSKG